MTLLSKPFPAPSSKLQVIQFGRAEDTQTSLPDVPRFAIYYDVLDELLYHARYRQQSAASLLLGGYHKDPEHGPFVEVLGFAQATYLPKEQPMHEWMEILKARRDRIRQELHNAKAPQALVGWAFALPNSQGLLTEEEATVHASFFHRDGHFALSIDFKSGQIAVYHRTSQGLLVQVPFWVVAPLQVTEKEIVAQLATQPTTHVPSEETPASESTPETSSSDEADEETQASEESEPEETPPEKDENLLDVDSLLPDLGALAPEPALSVKESPNTATSALVPHANNLLSSSSKDDSLGFAPSDFPLLSLPSSFSLEESEDHPGPGSELHTALSDNFVSSTDDSFDLSQDDVASPPITSTTTPEGFLHDEFAELLEDLSIPSSPERAPLPLGAGMPPSSAPAIEKVPHTEPSNEVVFNLNFGRPSHETKPQD